MRTREGSGGGEVKQKFGRDLSFHRALAGRNPYPTVANSTYYAREFVQKGALPSIHRTVFAVVPTAHGARNGSVGFLLKKITGYLLMPVPFATALILAGLALQLAKRAPRTRRWLIMVGAGWLALTGSNGISLLLVRPLESQFPPVPELLADAPLPAALAACRYVVVLGSGHTDAEGFSANNQLSLPAQSRILEGVRLWRALPNAMLVVSGPGRDGQPTHAEILTRAAVALGVPRTHIVQVATARDTEDETGELRRIAGDTPVALITSAWHMPRAIALARHTGLRVAACPADFTAVPRADGWSIGDYLGWDAGALQRSTWAVRERLGWAWIWLRGKTSPAPELNNTK